MLLQRAHQQQQATLRRCQEKVAKTKGLEETVRQQEKVTWGACGWRKKGRLGTYLWSRWDPLAHLTPP